MGIVNLTPDSFSGDGLFTSPRHHVTTSPDLNYITDYAQKLVDEGADILDVGAESSRPGAKPVSVKEELQRLIPVLKKIRKKVKIPLSIDTYKSEVASQALANGADIINDITALSADSLMAKVIKRHKAAVVLMHMKGKPRTMQVEPVYHNVMEEVTGYLRNAIMACLSAGIDFKKIVIDPGIGFGKTLDHTIAILKSLSQLKSLGRPIVIGTSRKSFIGKLTGDPVSERLAGTISSNCFAVTNGAHIVRVHDVKETKKAMAVLDTLLEC
ncbi:MAG: dihydropteroate synthase [Omnitrophica WOR_2 bacterium RIFOXYC2_FULL_43_9]|nr:MAG: dihydropteroate synthase [Omnitrophica WOR_2 bacterium RIFOXYC2_FULL_43_9]